MQEKEQKISMILNENKKQAKLLRTWRQLVYGCRTTESGDQLYYGM